jgi:DNA-binding NtrC family response regulator
MAVGVWAPPVGDKLPDLSSVDVLLVETYGLGEAQRELLDSLHEAAPLVEVVAISSDPGVEDAVQALRAGVFTVLEYPVSSDVIVTEVTLACERRRRAEQRIRQLGGEERWGGGADQTPAADDGDGRRRSDPRGMES